MISVAEEKVPGGKLLRVKAEYDGVVRNVQITGDFFVHPEEAVEIIEKTLFGIRTDASEETIKAIVWQTVAENGAELVGIDAEAIARVLKKAIK